MSYLEDEVRLLHWLIDKYDFKKDESEPEYSQKVSQERVVLLKNILACVEGDQKK